MSMVGKGSVVCGGVLPCGSETTERFNAWRVCDGEASWIGGTNG